MLLTRAKAISRARSFLAVHRFPVYERVGEKLLALDLEPRKLRGAAPSPGGLLWNEINNTNWEAHVDGEPYLITRSARRHNYTLSAPDGSFEVYDSIREAKEEAANLAGLTQKGDSNAL